MMRVREAEYWHVQKISMGIDGDAFSVVDDYGDEIASTHKTSRRMGSDKLFPLPVGKNARKIAATPELLHAAKLVLARWEHGDLAGAVRMLADAVEIADNGERLCTGLDGMCERRARKGFNTCGRHASRKAA